jgi:hypothetical protein
MRSTSLLFLTVILLSVSATAQRRPTGSTPQEKKVRVAIDMRVDNVPYTFTGEATCEHLAKGSIYDTLAERWSVQQQGDNGRSLSLTLWRPLAGGANMLTLALSTGGKRYDVDTVKKPKPSQASGSGTVRLAPEGMGGTITIEATTASSAKINGTIKCDSFTTSNPVAGD